MSFLTSNLVKRVETKVDPKINARQNRYSSIDRILRSIQNTGLPYIPVAYRPNTRRQWLTHSLKNKWMSSYRHRGCVHIRQVPLRRERAEPLLHQERPCGRHLLRRRAQRCYMSWVGVVWILRTRNAGLFCVSEVTSQSFVDQSTILLQNPGT